MEELEWAIRKTKRHKAAGGDEIPVDLVKKISEKSKQKPPENGE